MNNFIKKLIATCEENPSHAYDFFAREGFNASKEEMWRIILELLYAIADVHKDRSEADILQSVAGELCMMYDDE